ncbi:MAG: hypothetical protein J6S67_19665 [Methanobrevibacter sp.]|nr:hypothetical protein [Methanobrevibacter sp.]
MKTNQSKLLDLLADDGKPKAVTTTLAVETEKHIEEIEQRLTEKLDKIINNTTNSVNNPPAATETETTETNQTETDTFVDTDEINNVNYDD